MCFGEIMTNKNIKDIFFFGNGTVAVCDNKGDQVVELQFNPVRDFIKKAKKKGFKLDKAIIHLSNGKSAKIVEDNYSILED